MIRRGADWYPTAQPERDQQPEKPPQTRRQSKLETEAARPEWNPLLAKPYDVEGMPKPQRTMWAAENIMNDRANREVQPGNSSAEFLKWIDEQNRESWGRVWGWKRVPSNEALIYRVSLNENGRQRAEEILTELEGTAPKKKSSKITPSSKPVSKKNIAPEKEVTEYLTEAGKGTMIVSRVVELWKTETMPAALKTQYDTTGYAELTAKATAGKLPNERVYNLALVAEHESDIDINVGLLVKNKAGLGKYRLVQLDLQERATLHEEGDTLVVPCRNAIEEQALEQIISGASPKATTQSTPTKHQAVPPASKPPETAQSAAEHAIPDFMRESGVGMAAAGRITQTWKQARPGIDIVWAFGQGYQEYIANKKVGDPTPNKNQYNYTQVALNVATIEANLGQLGGRKEISTISTINIDFEETSVIRLASTLFIPATREITAADLDTVFGAGNTTTPEAKQPAVAAAEQAETKEAKEQRLLELLAKPENAANLVYTSLPQHYHPEGSAGFVGTFGENRADAKRYPSIAYVSPLRELAANDKSLHEFITLEKVAGNTPLSQYNKQKAGAEVAYRIGYFVTAPGAQNEHAYQDYSTRGGQELFTEVIVNKSTYEELSKYLNEHPEFIRKIAEQAFTTMPMGPDRNNGKGVSITQETWKQGDAYTNNIPLQPPYEKFAQTAGGVNKIVIFQNPTDYKLTDAKIVEVPFTKEVEMGVKEKAAQIEAGALAEWGKIPGLPKLSFGNLGIPDVGQQTVNDEIIIKANLLIVAQNARLLNGVTEVVFVVGSKETGLDLDPDVGKAELWVPTGKLTSRAEIEKELEPLKQTAAPEVKPPAENLFEKWDGELRASIRPDLTLRITTQGREVDARFLEQNEDEMDEAVLLLTDYSDRLKAIKTVVIDTETKRASLEPLRQPDTLKVPLPINETVEQTLRRLPTPREFTGIQTAVLTNAQSLHRKEVVGSKTEQGVMLKQLSDQEYEPALRALKQAKDAGKGDMAFLDDFVNQISRLSPRAKRIKEEIFK